MKKIRITAMLLLCTLMLSLLAGCGGETANTDGSQGSQNAAGTSQDGGSTTPDDGADTEPEEKEEVPVLLPDGTWYDGAEFNILVAGNFRNNDFQTDSTTIPVNQAKYKRLATLQEKYGIGFKYNDIIGFNTANGDGKGFKELETCYNSTSCEYDAAMIGTYDVSTAAYSGYLTDLNSDAMQYVDLTKSWWDQRANESLMIDGKMFYTTGDISLTDNIITNCIMFNKKLIVENDGMQNPYEMVKNNQWTWDNFTTEVKKFSVDMDGNDVMDQNDGYGLLTWNDAFLAAFSSARQSFAVINDKNEIQLSVYSQRSVSMVNKYIDLIRDDKSVYNYQVTPQKEWDAVRVDMFNNNQVVYSMTTFNTVPKHRDSETDFGILPFPKFSEDQENYGHLVSAFHCQFLCVPYFVDNAEKTSGIVEELAYLGKTTLTPAYYEQTLVGQYVRDDESIEMLDTIFASAMYDIGIYYKIGGLSSSVMTMAKSKQNTFASIYDSARASAESDIQQLNETFRELLGQ